MGEVSFRVVESRSRRRGSSRLSSRFLVSRLTGDGREVVWRLSPAGLRLLADVVSDALDVFEEREVAESAESADDVVES